MKTLRKSIALILALTLSLTVFSVFAERDKPLIGIIQIVDHVALDAARQGFIDALAENGYRSTAGGAAAIEQNKELFDKVFNPFAVKDTSRDALSDVKEGDLYYEAVRFAFENKAMAPVSEGVFGVNEPATMGDLVGTVMALVGIPGTPEEGIPVLAQVGVLSADEQADAQLTREKLGATFQKLLIAVAGMDPAANLAPLTDITDADQVTAGVDQVMQFALGNGLLLAPDGLLRPQDIATRAELANALWAISNME